MRWLRPGLLVAVILVEAAWIVACYAGWPSIPRPTHDGQPVERPPADPLEWRRLRCRMMVEYYRLLEHEYDRKVKVAIADSPQLPWGTLIEHWRRLAAQQAMWRRRWERAAGDPSLPLPIHINDRPAPRELWLDTGRALADFNRQWFQANPATGPEYRRMHPEYGR